MRRMRVMTWVGLVLAIGCSGDDDVVTYDPYYYETVYYDPYWYAYDAAWAYTWADPWAVTYALTAGQQQTVPHDLPGIADGVAGTAVAALSPAGCATAVADGATIDLSFDGCTGPLGLLEVRGSMRVTLSQSGPELVLTSHSDDLEIDGAPFLVDSVATVTRSDARREVSIVSSSRDPERVDAREAGLTVSWAQGSGCIAIDGDADLERDGLAASSELSSFQRCAGACPSQGTMTVTGDSGEFSAVFDGTDELVVSLPNGSDRSFQLQCE